MNFSKIIGLLAALVFTVGAWRQFGWPGLALAAGGVVMWVLLHFTRLMSILQKAAKRPVGYVASAVMLNAKLKKGMTLMHVMAMTQSLGALQTPKDTQPEVFVWTDPGESKVRCTFVSGKLQEWALARPAAEGEAPASTSADSAPTPPSAA